MRNTDWFVNAKYGVFMHWTKETQPEYGERKNYAEAVDNFDVKKLANQLYATGAKYLFFTISHIHMYLPFWCETLNETIKGRCTKRDLIEELYNELNKYDIKLMLYYNADGVRDDEWIKVSKFETDPSYHSELTYQLTKEISDKYGKKISGWWIDGCYDKGIYKEYGVRYDFNKYANALRSGNPDSLVAFNFRGVENWVSKTGVGIADFQAGETGDLSRLPLFRYSGESDTQWHTLCYMDDFWVHDIKGTVKPRFDDLEVADFMEKIIKNQGVFSYNTAPYQEGYLACEVVNQLKNVNAILKERGVL